MYSELKKLGLELETTKSVSIEEINKFEKELSLTFGEELKAYLQEFGCLGVEYLEFYGICGENRSIPSMVHATKSMRNEIDNFPNNLVVFYEDGSGAFYALDESDNVYVCNYNKCEKIEMKLKNFLLQQLKGL